MDRRKILAGAGIALSPSLMGCLARSSSSGDTGDEDGMTGEDGQNDNGNDSEVVEEDPRVDEPPYNIDRPQPPEDPEDREEWNAEYLGEQMDTEPSLDFDQRSVRRGVVRDHGLTGLDGEAYWVELLTSESDRDEVLELDAAVEDTRAWLGTVDFDQSVLVVVESGYGSGSVEHRWARVEAVSDGLHLHGYYTDPYEQTDDITTRVSVLEVERPDDLNLARVSLTVDEDRRVHFNSTEGVVSVDVGAGSANGPTDDGESDEVFDSPRDLVLENQHDKAHTIIVSLTHDADEIHSGKYDIEPDSDRRIKNVMFEPGDYLLEATLEDGTSETVEQTVTNEVWHGYVTITEDKDLFISYDVE